MAHYRYGRDYYINDARRASGSRKKATPEPTTPTLTTPPATVVVVAPGKEVSVEPSLSLLLNPQEKQKDTTDSNNNNSSDNYIMAKFLKDDESALKPTNTKSGVGVLQRSMSLKSLSGGAIRGSSSSLTNSRRDVKNMDEDNFSVLSLDQSRRNGSRTGTLLARRPHYASEVQLSPNVLAQFEAKSLFADLKRDSFRARNGTTNFALNPIFDESMFTPPPVHQVPMQSCFITSTPTPSVCNTNGNAVNLNRASEEEKEDEQSNINLDNDENNNNSFNDDTKSSWNYRASQEAAMEAEGKRNCTETTFESLGDMKRKSAKLQVMKDFSDNLY